MRSNPFPISSARRSARRFSDSRPRGLGWSRRPGVGGGRCRLSLCGRALRSGCGQGFGDCNMDATRWLTTLMLNGKLLMAGGVGSNDYLTSAQICDSADDTLFADGFQG